MRLARLIVLALLAFAAPAALPAKETEIVVRGDVKRSEIERVLDADNVDTSRLSEREVADAIGAVKRGRAPEDFWAAYRRHVRAWERFASAVEKADGPGGTLSDAEAAVRAEQAIEATFDEVERIARSYGARLPTPPLAIPPTV